jgi:hypothetical protein
LRCFSVSGGGWISGIVSPKEERLFTELSSAKSTATPLTDDFLRFNGYQTFMSGDGPLEWDQPSNAYE